MLSSTWEKATAGRRSSSPCRERAQADVLSRRLAAGFRDRQARLPWVGRARARGSTIRARSSSGVSVVDLEGGTLESTLGLIAATWAIAMALGPVLQIRKIIEQKTSRSVSVGYFLILLVGFALWLAYGIAASSFVLIVPNAIAAVVILATIAVALRFRRVPGPG